MATIYRPSVLLMYSATSNYPGMGKREFPRQQKRAYPNAEAARPDLLTLRELASQGRGLYPAHVIHAAWLELETTTREVIEG